MKIWCICNSPACLNHSFLSSNVTDVNRKHIRLAIDYSRSAILGLISGFNEINNFQMFVRRDSHCLMNLE